MTKNYHNHLISLGYEKQRTYNGQMKWIKPKKPITDKYIGV